MAGSTFAPCQHGSDGGVHGRGSRSTADGTGRARTVVAPWPVRAPGRPPERRHRPGLPVRVLRGHPVVGQPSQPGVGTGPHQCRLPGHRRPPRDRRPGGLYAAHQCRAAPGGPVALPPLPDQPLDPVPQPRVTRGYGTRGGSGLPTDDPVRGDRGRHRLRPRDPGHRIGGGAQRHLLVLAGRVPRHPRLPGTGRPRARLDFGLHPGRGGRRRRGGPARRLRRAVLPPHTGPGAGQPHHPRGVGPHPLRGRRPLHVAARAAGPALRRVDGGPGPARPGRRLGGSQLAPRRRLPMGLRGRLRPRHLPDRPVDRLRPGQHPGRHTHHPRRPRRGRVRAGHDAGRLRPPRRAGPVGGPRLPGRQLLATHPLRRPGLRLHRARAPIGAPPGLEAGPRPAGAGRQGAG